MEERNAHSEIPPSRFNAGGFYPVDINATGGFFLHDDPRLFDNTFFGINNIEASFMDPQQRKLLEATFHCFEDAGYSMDDMAGSDTGCFVGNFTNDFQIMQNKDPEAFSRYSATGFGTTILANRINNVFDLRGPSMVVDTACSSSFYSLHLACSALQRQECKTAICAAANLIQSPELIMSASKAGILSNTSMCHTFDISADGYARAEGIGALFLKRLSDAIRDGDRIRAVIKATAVNR